MSEQWQPDPDGLAQLVHIFTGLLDPNAGVRQQANEALAQATSIAEFDNYLLHILLMDDTSVSIPLSTRSNAGLYLKNDLLKNWATKPAILQSHILTMLPHGLINPTHQIRKITAIIISSIFRKIGLNNWQNLLPNLLQLLDGDAGLNGQIGSMEVLALITEDSCRLLDRDYQLNNQGDHFRPLESLVPRFISLIGSEAAVDPNVKANAIKCLVHCINIGSMIIQVNLNKLMPVLFAQCQVANDPKVINQLTIIFCSILEQWPRELYENFNGIIQWMLHIISSTHDEKLALNACEFLLSMVSNSTPKELISPNLQEMVPLLLSRMVYSHDDVLIMEAEDSKDQSAEDKDEDIKPQNVKSKEHTVANNTSTKKNHTSGGGDSDSDSDSDDDDSDDDDDDDDAEFSYVWNLRKCSAATIDSLSNIFPIEILHLSFPIIKQNIQSSSWPIRESSILTLGAISEAALEHASNELPELIAFLLECIKDSQPRVRQMSSWTLGRYSTWVCSQAMNHGSFANYYQPTFEILLNLALDNNKVVQESSCSAIADFIENSDDKLLSPMISVILTHFQLYFQRYKRKNLLILYDTIQTFVEKVGDHLQSNQQYIDLLLPPLLTKWSNLDDYDKDLWPLLECMSTIAANLGEAFINYSLPIYQRSIRILSMCIEMDKMAKVQKGFDAPEKDFIVSSLDLIDGLILGLSKHSMELIQQQQQQQQSNEKTYSLMELVLICLDDDDDDVRQSSFAILGDLAIHLCDLMIKPYLQTIMVCINNEINNPSEYAIASRNNSIWALGEISIRIPRGEFEQYLKPMTLSILQIIHNVQNDEDETLIENACITLGRFGIVNFTEIGPILKLNGGTKIIKLWFECMLNAIENEEKENTFIGMIQIINSCPELVINDVEILQLIVKSLLEYNNIGNDLGQIFYNYLNSLKTQLGDSNWAQLILMSGYENNLKLKYNL